VPAASTNNGRDRLRGGNRMRKSLLILGVLMLAIGLLWIGQGTGTIAWPKTSFMINQIQWAGYGAVLAALGLILIWQSRR
jgi:cell division protein FtsW (lipid II flippase)